LAWQLAPFCFLMTHWFIMLQYAFAAQSLLVAHVVRQAVPPASQM
jgi:hypothetical protein